MKTIIATLRYLSDKEDDYEFSFSDDATNEEVEGYLKKLTFELFVRKWKVKQDEE